MADTVGGTSRVRRAAWPGRGAWLTVVAIVAVAAWASAAAQPMLPSPRGPINDFAELLAPDDEARLTRLVEEVEQATTAEIAVATVRSLDGLAVEEYATRLFNAWGVGQAAEDNGVLILVAPAEREMRIEVGYGLEGILPDGLAGQIVRETFLPAFRADDYRRGIVEGTERVAAIVRRNQPLTDEERRALTAVDGRSGNHDLVPFLMLPFFGAFVAIGFGFAGAGLGARSIFPIIFGIVFGGLPLALTSLVELPSWGQRILQAAAVAAVVVGYRKGRRPENRASLRGATTGKSGWVMGGDGGGSGSSGSSSGSDSSSGFGGGSSGGGGASGRW